MHPNLTTKELNRYWAKVDKSGGPDACWIWTAAKSRSGHGLFYLQGRNRYAHRVAYLIEFGHVPDNLEVCHNCPDGDNSSCVNPNHMFLGTHKENMHDMIQKGRDRCLYRWVDKPRGPNHGRHASPHRTARGEGHGMARLTVEQVLDIRERYAAGQSQRTLAAEFGVTNTAIGHIVRGKTWAHLPGPRIDGSDRLNSTLTDDDVREIHRRFQAGQAKRAIARHFGISHRTVGRLVNGVSRKHLAP